MIRSRDFAYWRNYWFPIRTPVVTTSREFDDLLPLRCKTYPDFVHCCLNTGCRLHLAYRIEAWNMIGSVNNARMFKAVLDHGDFNPNDQSRQNRAVLLKDNT